MSEKLCLQWNEFRENAYGAFARLRENIDFADVTLASEDGQQVEAHRVILAAASPFFQNLLKRNKHSHIVESLFERGEVGIHERHYRLHIFGGSKDRSRKFRVLPRHC